MHVLKKQGTEREKEREKEGMICKCGHGRMIHTSKCHIKNCKCKGFRKR